MIYKINKLLFICGLLLNTLACSTCQSIETDSQSKIDLSGNLIVVDTFNLNCELMYIHINSDKELVFPNGNISPTLNIRNGKYTGFGVCNRFEGMYVKKENAIKYKSGMTTLVNYIEQYSGIADLTGNEIESLISRILGQVNNYSVEKDKLILRQDLHILMIYRII